jgi:predicted N-formylglutamate amidohydrolase
MHNYDAPLLGPDEPPPYTILNADGAAPFILTCEHAGIAVPAKLNRLGLEDEDYTKHYAFDIGVKRVTETLSALLNAPAILSNYSRLVVDLNRIVTAPTAFAASGEGKPVPGNVTMTDADRICRTLELYEPYDAALSGMIDRAIGRGLTPPLVSIHSFTPQFYNFRRPWEVGFLWTHDDRLPRRMIDYFTAAGYVVGDNQPYDHRILRGSAINRHGDSRRLANVLVEIRQDLIANDEDSDKWAKIFADCLKEVLADDQLYSYYDGPLTPHDPEKERLYYEALAAASKRGEYYG